jgi:enoyl-CoA hydratase/carnithine racemase
VAGPDAIFGLTEIRLALWPFLIYRAVEAALGERRTLELALTGRTFSVVDALEMLLIHESTVDPLPRAHEIARSVSDFSPTAVHAGMAFVREARGRAPRESAQIAQVFRNQLFNSADFKEGIRAFHERRAPSWPSISEMEP